MIRCLRLSYFITTVCVEKDPYSQVSLACLTVFSSVMRPSSFNTDLRHTLLNIVNQITHMRNIRDKQINVPNLILQLITKLARTTCVCVLFTHMGHNHYEISLRFYNSTKQVSLSKFLNCRHRIELTGVTTLTVHSLCNCYFRSKSDEKKLNALREKINVL